MKNEALVANSVGTYEERVPVNALRGHFHRAWFKRYPQEVPKTVRVVPDGCVDLLWCDDRFVVAGPDATAASSALRSGGFVLGMRFKPGAARRWLDLPMTEIVGMQVDMQDIWGQRAREIAERMQEANGLEEQFGLLNALLAKMAPSIEPASGEGAAIFGALERGAGNDTGGQVDILADGLAVSGRTLRRRSRELFGYGPKTLHRILRFQQFMVLARLPDRRGLAELACAAGYSDQAHLNREVRALCSMTAGDLVRQIAS